MNRSMMRSVLLLIFGAMATASQAYAQATCSDTDYDCKIAVQTTKIATHPNDPEAYYNRAYAYKNKGDFARAKLDLDKYVSLPSTNPQYLADGYADRGWARYKTDDVEGALADYAKAIATNPKNSLAYFRRAMIYSDQNKWQLAIDNYDTALRYDPKEAEVYYNRGRLYRLMKNYDKAISEFTTYIAVNSAKVEYAADGYRLRGMTYADLGKYDMAVSDLTKAIQLDPQINTSYIERAKAYRKLGKSALADADDAKAAELKRN